MHNIKGINNARNSLPNAIQRQEINFDGSPQFKLLTPKEAQIETRTKSTKY